MFFPLFSSVYTPREVKLALNGNAARHVLEDVRANGVTPEQALKIASRCCRDGDIVFEEDREKFEIISILEQFVDISEDVRVAIDHLQSVPRAGW